MGWREEPGKWRAGSMMCHRLLILCIAQHMANSVFFHSHSLYWNYFLKNYERHKCSWLQASSIEMGVVGGEKSDDCKGVQCKRKTLFSNYFSMYLEYKMWRLFRMSYFNNYSLCSYYCNTAASALDLFPDVSPYFMWANSFKVQCRLFKSLLLYRAYSI